MSGLTVAAGDYLAVRRALGYKLEEDGRLLASFVAYLEAHDIETVTVAAALAWATESARRGNGARRLSTVRCFARYLQAVDPAHEVPPTGLLPKCKTRPVPHLYSDAEIASLMTAARLLDPPIWAVTVETVIGVLCVTGMRVGEVLGLNAADIDADTAVATVWLSKFNKSRHVPLAASTLAALGAYSEQRRRLLPTATTTAVFVSPSGQRLTYPRFAAAFATLLDTTSVSTPRGRRPRIHDFRHSFAVRTILGWYRDDADVHALLPRLSTYLGHVAPASTYWYLSAAPELMTVVAERLDRNQEPRR